MEKYLLKQCEKHGIPLKTLQAAQKQRGESSGERLAPGHRHMAAEIVAVALGLQELRLLLLLRSCLRYLIDCCCMFVCVYHYQLLSFHGLIVWHDLLSCALCCMVASSRGNPARQGVPFYGVMMRRR